MTPWIWKIDALDEARKTWSLGKQLSLYADNKDEVIVALVKEDAAKIINVKQSIPKRGRERNYI